MKERKISRRAVCSAMVASLALGVLEGCGSSSSTTSSAAGSGAAASNERITVRILKSKAANEVAAEQMDVWKVLGEKFNMDFEFDNPPQDNYNERLNLVMMDAQLPDIIMDMPTTEVLKYGESGVIPVPERLHREQHAQPEEGDRQAGRCRKSTDLQRRQYLLYAHAG